MKQIAIVHYNTPELTKAAVESIRRHGGKDYRVIIFDNSDEKPYDGGGVKIIDNTQGQCVDFDAELKKYPKRNPRIACPMGCNYGSTKHMMSVEWLLQHEKNGFVLCDSDILVRENIDRMFDTTLAAIGEMSYQTSRHIPRLLPLLCWINAPMLRKAGIHYHDPERSYGLFSDDMDDKRNWYDTGASLLEDLQKSDLPWREQKINGYIYHYGSGSWRNKMNYHEWLIAHQDLWSDGKCQDEDIIKKINFMEHVEKKTARWGYTQLVAEKGFLIKSKATGKTYQEITVPNPDGYEVIPLPTSAKAAPKKTAAKAK